MNSWFVIDNWQVWFCFHLTNRIKLCVAIWILYMYMIILYVWSKCAFWSPWTTFVHICITVLGFRIKTIFPLINQYKSGRKNIDLDSCFNRRINKHKWKDSGNKAPYLMINFAFLNIKNRVTCASPQVYILV